MATFTTEQLTQWLEGAETLAQLSVGRRPDNDLVLANPRVSGQHAVVIRCSPDFVLVKDLDSKNGTFVNGSRISRKLIATADTIGFAEECLTGEALMAHFAEKPQHIVLEEPPAAPPPADPLNFTAPFAELRLVFEQYPQLRKDCRKREKMIKTTSVVLSSVIGVGATVATAGSGLLVLHLMSSAGLGILLPTLCSTLLSTDEKIELIDKQFKERYRCPNPDCRDPFGMREWEQLAQQKKCRKCQAIWVA